MKLTRIQYVCLQENTREQYLWNENNNSDNSAAQNSEDKICPVCSSFSKPHNISYSCVNILT